MVSLFTSQIPATADASDGTPGIVTGTTVIFSEDGFVTHIRFYATATVGGSDTYTGSLYEVTGPDNGAGAGVLLGDVDFSSSIVSAGQWNSIALTPKIPVVAGVGYRTALFTGTSGRYVSTSHVFDVGSGITNGPITAPEHGTDPFGFGVFRQGVFRVNSDGAYPNDSFNGSSYFIDVVFQPKVHSKGAEFMSFL